MQTMQVAFYRVEESYVTDTNRILIILLIWADVSGADARHSA